MKDCESPVGKNLLERYGHDGCRRLLCAYAAMVYSMAVAEPLVVDADRAQWEDTVREDIDYLCRYAHALGIPVSVSENETRSFASSAWRLLQDCHNGRGYEHRSLSWVLRWASQAGLYLIIPERK